MSHQLFFAKLVENESFHKQIQIRILRLLKTVIAFCYCIFRTIKKYRRCNSEKPLFSFKSSYILSWIRFFVWFFIYVHANREQFSIYFFIITFQTAVEIDLLAKILFMISSVLWYRWSGFSLFFFLRLRIGTVHISKFLTYESFSQLSFWYGLLDPRLSQEVLWIQLCPSVKLFFLGLVHYFFSNFCMKLGFNKH